MAIIGIVAAISIPSVISNSQQQEFKTGLKKAVSSLNSAIALNIALENESPYDNRDTFNYLMRHMNVIKSVYLLPWRSYYESWSGGRYDSDGNAAFYTADGMRFEFDDIKAQGQVSKELLKLHESDQNACFASWSVVDEDNPQYYSCNGCGSYGLKNNPNNTTKPPCAILVDVNGDRKPTPQKAATDRNACMADADCAKAQKYWVPTPDSNRVSDIFVILITEDRAIPYGVVAQKAMYQAQKR